MNRYDVFLSHASADKPAVERLARRLRDEKLEPFLDKWHLVPGDPWQEALEEALDQNRTCAVFIGKAWDFWQHEEMRSALEEQVRNPLYRVIPVLLPGGEQPSDRDLPRFLRRRTWVDFRNGLDDEDAFRRLLAGIQGKAPGPDGSGGEGSATLLDRGAEKPYRCLAQPGSRSFSGELRELIHQDGLTLEQALQTVMMSNPGLRPLHEPWGRVFGDFCRRSEPVRAARDFPRRKGHFLRVLERL